MRRLLVVAVASLLVVALFFVLVTQTGSDETATPPPQKEVTVTLHDITISVPDGWRTRTEAGVAYAYEPCLHLPCKEVAVYGQDALQGADWRTILQSNVTCRSNPREKPDAITPRGTRMIGDHGAFYYTMDRCGVSNIETLGIWETQIPSLLIVAERDPLSKLPDLDTRLSRARWTA